MVIYCFLYYRGLAIVVVSSLVIAGLIVYALILLLGHSYGFTLTLPEIAGSDRGHRHHRRLVHRLLRATT